MRSVLRRGAAIVCGGFLGAVVFMGITGAIFSPTTRTPRLTVGPGDTVVENLIVNGECTGCGGGGGGLTGYFAQIDWVNPDEDTAGKMLGFVDPDGDIPTLVMRADQWLFNDGVGDGPTKIVVNGTIEDPDGNEWVKKESGTFNLTFDNACTADYVVPVSYVKIGRAVTLEFSIAANCTSDSSSFQTSGADLPSDLRPASNTYFSGFRGIDNGTNISACVRLNSGGVVQFGTASGGQCTSAGWTGSGSKAWSNSGNLTVSYLAAS